MPQFPGNLVRPISGFDRYREAREKFSRWDEDEQAEFVEAMNAGSRERRHAVALLLGDDETTGAEGATPPATVPAEQPTDQVEQPAAPVEEEPAGDPAGEPTDTPPAPTDSGTSDDELATVLHSNVGDVIDYAEAHPEHAARLAELERDRVKPRTTLLDDLDRLTADHDGAQA